MEKSEESVSLEKQVKPKRNINLIAAINVILSVMIGSGIFVSPTAALKYSGSIALCLIVWTLSGIVSLLCALCFAELGTIIPRSGAEYAYLLETFGGMNKFWGQIPAFVCSFVYVIVLRPAEVAVIVLTCAEYTVQPLSSSIGLKLMDKHDQENFIKLVSIIILGIITYINFTSVKLYVRINNVFSVCKLIVCIVVICIGIYQLAIGNTKNLDNPFEGSTRNPGFIALAFCNGLWAYDGWSSITTITEEIKAPEKNIPRSIAIAVPIVTAIYVFMNLSYMTVLSPSEMINSPAVALDFGARVLGPFSVIVPIGVALATFGCAMSIQFGVTRMCSVAAQENHMLRPLSYIHIKKFTPIPAVAMQALIALLFIVVGDISELIEFASFIMWVFYGSGIVCLLVLRKTMKDVPRPYKVPIIIPIFTLIVTIFLSLTPVIVEPSIKYLAAMVFIVVGVMVYVPFVYHKIRPKCMDKITHALQCLCLVVPPVADKSN